MHHNLVEAQRRELIRLIEAHLTPGDDTRFLEIGFGEGLLLQRMAERYPTSIFQGIEVTPRHVEQARARGYDVWRTDADRLTLDRTYHVIFGTGVLHHLELPLRFLHRIHDALQPGGLIVFGAEAHRLALLNHAYAIAMGHWALERGALRLERRALTRALRARYAHAEVYLHDQSLVSCAGGLPLRLFRLLRLHRLTVLNELWLYAIRSSR